MISYKKLKEKGLIVTSIKKISNNTFLIHTKDSQYIIKKHTTDLSKTFNYLNARSFTNYPKYKFLEEYDLYSYINDSDISKEERLYEMINLLVLLHTKTTRFKKIDIDDNKAIYEEIKRKVDYLENYYISLNELIDSEIYMAPSHYLLAKNISKIYNAISFCKYELDSWYELIKNSTKQRMVLTHNNLDLSHVLYDKSPYFINWNKSEINNPIFDLKTIYNKYYNEIDFDILLNSYQKKYPLTKKELKLLFIMISIPNKIEFVKDELSTINKVKETINKIEKGDKLIRKYYTKK